MKKCTAGIAAFVMAAILVFPVGAISAERAILLDGQTGRVLYEKGADERSLIASTTKIMTALVVCEQCNVLDRVKIPKEAVGIEGSSMYLQEGEVLAVQELLYGLMLHSGNDAAAALAIYCGGTVEGFAELMNDKAHTLGLNNTHFVNPHGLDAPDHYSTARDLALLTAYAMENPIFAKTVSTKSVKIGERYLTNHNKLLWQLEGAEGVKTGYTKAAGRILVSSASRSGRRLIAVTINAPNDWEDHKALYKQGFEDFAVHELVSEGQVLGPINVIGGDTETVDLIAGSDFLFALRKGEDLKIILPKPGFVYAPVSQGESAGVAHVILDEIVVGRIPLEYGQSAEQKQDSTKKLPWWKSIL